MDNDPKKGVIVSACKAKVAARRITAWGATAVNEKALANTAQAGGWGNIGACRNKATSNTGLGRSTFNSRNSRGKHSVAHNFDGGWKKFNEPWDKGKNVNGIPTSSWSNSYVKNKVDSCGKGKDDVRHESTWGKAESFGKGLQEETFGKAAASFGNKPKAFGADVNPSLNKQDVGSFLNKQDDGSWKKQGGFSCSSWERAKTFEGGPSSGGRSGRGGGQGGRDQCGRGRGGGRGGRGQSGRGRGEGRGGRDQFGRGRGSSQGGANQFGRGRPCDQGQTFAQAFGGWKKGRTDDNADQHGCLEKPKTFEGGRGLGGRTGRGANQGGRSTQNYGTNAGMSMANHPSSWGKFQGFDGSKKAVVFTGDEMISTRPGDNTPSWSGDQAAGGWGKPRITMQVGRMMLKQVARAAQVMGDQIDSWGNKKKDGYGWSKK